MVLLTAGWSGRVLIVADRDPGGKGRGSVRGRCGRPARRSGGRVLPVRSGGRTAGSLRSGVCRGSAAGTTGTRTPWRRDRRRAVGRVVAAHYFPAPTTVGLATGTTFPDALGGGAAMALAGGPLLLSDPSTLPAATASYLTTVKAGVGQVLVFGGTGAVADPVAQQVAGVLG